MCIIILKGKGTNDHGQLSGRLSDKPEEIRLILCVTSIIWGH